MRINSCVFIFLLSVGMFICNCSNSPTETAGGASGTELSAHVVTGSVYFHGGPVVGATVFLRTSDYLSGSEDASPGNKKKNTITDSNGSFKFDSTDTGNYSIEVNYSDSLAILIPCNVSTNDTIKVLHPDTLMPISVINGQINLLDTGSKGFKSSIVQVYGLERCIKPDSLGFYSVKVPSGKHTLCYKADSLDTNKINYDVQIMPNEQKEVVTDIKNGAYIPRSYENDSLIVRQFLDSSGVPNVTVDSVVSKRNPKGRIAGLDLNNLGITKISSSITQLNDLEYLNLKDNNLGDSIAVISRLVNLKTLLLHNNQIKNVPGTFSSLVNISNIDFSDNELRTLPTDLLKLNHRFSIDVSNNHLVYISQEIQFWLNEHSRGWNRSQTP